MAFNIPLRIRNLIKRASSNDPYDIAKFLGVHIRIVDKPPHINGFWKRILRRKFIFVSDRLDEWQQKAVIGHEIGHILLHPQYKYFCQNGRTYYCSQKHEDEANNFSVELLKYNITDISCDVILKFLQEGWK